MLTIHCWIEHLAPKRNDGRKMTLGRPKRATVHDLAREAGVSLATIDRVLNGRAGVRPATIAKVEAAVASLEFRRDFAASLLARSRDLRIRFILPDGPNQFMQSLDTAIAKEARRATSERMQISTDRVRPLDSRAMIAALKGLNPENCDCAVIVTTESEAVRNAVDDAERRGVPIVTLVSDLPGSARRHFVGIDNVAAGRTAASLMGRFVSSGKIGLVVGSLALRDHRERLEGFMSVAREEFKGLRLIGPIEGNDEAGMTKAAVSALIADNPDLCGLYSLGAGNSGLLEALHETRREGRLKVILHELTESTRQALRSDAVDVVLDQNPEGEIRAAVATARAIGLKTPENFPNTTIKIGIFLRDNLG